MSPCGHFECLGMPVYFMVERTDVLDTVLDVILKPDVSRRSPAISTKSSSYTALLHMIPSKLKSRRPTQLCTAVLAFAFLGSIYPLEEDSPPMKRIR